METSYRNITNEIGRTFEMIEEDPSTESIEYPTQGVSCGPMKSPRIRECNVAVLLTQHTAGISHHNLETGDPKLYIPKLITDVRKYEALHYLDDDGPNDISAVLIGGDGDHFESIREVLSNDNIPIVGRYCDNWNESSIWADRVSDAVNGKSSIGDKIIVVNPVNSEVLMYSPQTKHIRLTSKKHNNLESIRV